MARNDKSLDEQIAAVERRLAHHRSELRLLAAEARSRISVTKSLPVAVIAALGVGFLASRFVRRPARVQPQVDRHARSRSARMAGAIAAAVLPRLVKPLQHAVAHWLSQRMQQRAAHAR